MWQERCGWSEGDGGVHTEYGRQATGRGSCADSQGAKAVSSDPPCPNSL